MPYSLALGIRCFRAQRCRLQVFQGLRAFGLSGFRTLGASGFRRSRLSRQGARDPQSSTPQTPALLASARRGRAPERSSVCISARDIERARNAKASSGGPPTGVVACPLHPHYTPHVLPTCPRSPGYIMSRMSPGSPASPASHLSRLRFCPTAATFWQPDSGKTLE